MTANDIIEDARVARVRALRKELTEANGRLVQMAAERDALAAHAHLAAAALHDFEQLGADVRLRIIDGWNAILHGRSVAKLSAEDISKLKADYLAALGIDPARPDVPGSPPPPLAAWIIFDGPEENSYRSGAYRVTYTGGTGPQRADRLILDYVHAAKILGLNVSRITVETADKSLARKLTSLGAVVPSEQDASQTPTKKF